MKKDFWERMERFPTTAPEPGDELTASEVVEILCHLYKVSKKEKVFCI